MKSNASDPKNVTQAQAKGSRLNNLGAAGSSKRPGNAASASQEASEPAKRGEPIPADKKSDRSPKQENL